MAGIEPTTFSLRGGIFTFFRIYFFRFFCIFHIFDWILNLKGKILYGVSGFYLFKGQTRVKDCKLSPSNYESLDNRHEKLAEIRTGQNTLIEGTRCTEGWAMTITRRTVQERGLPIFLPCQDCFAHAISNEGLIASRIVKQQWLKQFRELVSGELWDRQLLSI